MTAASYSRPVDDLAAGSLTMPPFGAVTNGLRATSWVPLVELPPGAACQLLLALGACGVAACRRAPLRPGRRHPREQVWVDATGYATAEDLARVLGRAQQPGEHPNRRCSP
jgi:hypothetical protein